VKFTKAVIAMATFQELAARPLDRRGSRQERGGIRILPTAVLSGVPDFCSPPGSISTKPPMRQQKVIDPFSIVTLPIPDVLRRLALQWRARPEKEGNSCALIQNRMLY